MSTPHIFGCEIVNVIIQINQKVNIGMAQKASTQNIKLTSTHTMKSTKVETLLGSRQRPQTQVGDTVK